MDDQFPRARKTKTGGTTMILGCLCNYCSPWTGHAWQKNPVAARKKKYFEFYTSVFRKIRVLIAGQNPFARRKNLSNTGDTPPLPKRRNGRELGASVTTSHLFWPNQRRKRAICYRVGYGISIFHHVNVGRGGGVRTANPCIRPRSKSAHGNFTPHGTLLCSDAREKSAVPQDRTRNGSHFGSSNRKCRR